MRRDVRVHIEDIFESITKIEDYTKEISEKDFLGILKYRTLF